ncbi:hypothetical protein COT97_05710 [Candidatus Falkowbacteria bacterium CG10_big_fil_rev_8_21_14_0_10_39_11]|uniref:Uncharacterized protein n=1 Tax=Candidatus Falkowbacteria bacterium CG10_big_fil_rev_8_21_14_0_10_39_11 TaxID=1974565 RepID=A0A2H0V3I4_9BACT|nr:MAG: hypothetical protein COT97_05710 [Candidatus Falkowbacteria bacterium CG10_big_fil_rev_8_21_14_0_10_39_11]
MTPIRNMLFPASLKLIGTSPGICFFIIICIETATATIFLRYPGNPNAIGIFGTLIFLVGIKIGYRFKRVFVGCFIVG